MEARTLLLGDWSRPVRDPIDLLRVSYVLGVPLVWVIRDDFPLNLTVSAVAVIAVRFLLPPRPYDLAVVGGTLLVAWAVYGWGSVRRVPGENRSEEVAA